MSQTLETLLNINKKLDKLDCIQNDITDIKIQHAQLPCKNHRFRIKLIEKVVFGAIGIIIVGYLYTLSPNLKPKKMKPNNLISTPSGNFCVSPEGKLQKKVTR